MPGKYETLGVRVGALVDVKNQAYGNSFDTAGEFLKLLYPNGIRPEQYDDMLALGRIFDKMKRIATDRDALGESPYQDIAGYGLLGLARVEAQRVQALIKKTGELADKLQELETSLKENLPSDLLSMAARESAPVAKPPAPACPPELHSSKICEQQLKAAAPSAPGEPPPALTPEQGQKLEAIAAEDGSKLFPYVCSVCQDAFKTPEGLAGHRCSGAAPAPTPEEKKPRTRRQRSHPVEPPAEEERDDENHALNRQVKDAHPELFPPTREEEPATSPR
jgi:hypothetical protein